MYTYDDVPAALHQAIGVRLGVPQLELQPLSGGTNDRTFQATYQQQSWVVRIEDADGLQLRRAYNAQTLALSAGVATPQIVAAQLEAYDAQPFLWIVEEHTAGVQFFPKQFERAERNALARNLGQQLRLLHGITVDDFGIMPPDPWGITQPTFAAWLDHEISRIGRAMEHAAVDPALLPQIMAVYAMLRDSYPDRPRLCHGDCATTNILVDQGHVVALIDWEWANGGDPAANVAYWDFWQEDMSSA